MCREYNKFASSVSEESNKMKAVQKGAVAHQVRLDEESLQRLKEAEAKDKVRSQVTQLLILCGVFIHDKSTGVHCEASWWQFLYLNELQTHSGPSVHQALITAESLRQVFWLEVQGSVTGS